MPNPCNAPVYTGFDSDQNLQTASEHDVSVSQHRTPPITQDQIKAFLRELLNEIPDLSYVQLPTP